MLGTQSSFVELAHAGAGHLVHERPVLGNPPTRDLVGAILEEPLAELIGGDEGKQRMRDNAEWAADQGVRNPERLFRTLGPITRSGGG